MLIFSLRDRICLNNFLAQSAGTAEYIDCIFAERYDSSNECSDNDAKQFDDVAPVILEL